MLTQKAAHAFYSSFIHNFQTWKQLQCHSVGEQINKL